MRWFFISSQFYSQFSVRAMIVVAKAGNCPPESSRSFQRTFYKAANWPVLRVCLETQLIIRVLFWWLGMDCWQDCQWSLILTLIDNSLILLSQPLIMLWHVTLKKKFRMKASLFSCPLPKFFAWKYLWGSEMQMNFSTKYSLS